jgi:1-deoxy-D-xylulose-5-phosphate synthase
VGKLVAACEQAALMLAAEGIETTVWDARLVAPLDQAMIEDALGHDLVVSVEDGITEGGAGWRIEAALRRRAPLATAPRVVNCGVPTAFLPHGDAAGILARLGLDGPGITRVVREHL